jgi:hypothetical protein
MVCHSADSFAVEFGGMSPGATSAREEVTFRT